MASSRSLAGQELHGNATPPPASTATNEQGWLGYVSGMAFGHQQQPGNQSSSDAYSAHPEKIAENATAGPSRWPASGNTAAEMGALPPHVGSAGLLPDEIANQHRRSLSQDVSTQTRSRDRMRRSMAREQTSPVDDDSRGRSVAGGAADDGPSGTGSLSIGATNVRSADALREPRRSIRKRPHEFDLAARDPHNGVRLFKTKGIRRQVAFAAPYSTSGIVLSEPSKWSDWMIPGPLTFGRGQFWYLVLGQSLVAALISGAINFGVGVATYNHYESTTVIRLWQWIPVPLAGDMGVTVIIQQIVSMLITSALVHNDLAKGPVGPLRRPWPPLLHLPSTPSPSGSWLGVKLPSEVARDNEEKGTLYMGKATGKGRFASYAFWFIRSMLTGSERNDLLAPGISWRQRVERILWTAVQGFVFCLLTFWWFWPISIAIVAPIYGGRNLSGTYIPAIVKLLYGGIMALLTNPIMALMAMGAESSVRRAYPELEIWQPFGGEQDYQAWIIEQGIDPRDVEMGPNGVAVSSRQVQREEQEKPQRQTTKRDQDVEALAADEGRRTRYARPSTSSQPPTKAVGGTSLSTWIAEEPRADEEESRPSSSVQGGRTRGQLRPAPPLTASPSTSNSRASSH